jgi:hypothetical protein
VLGVLGVLGSAIGGGCGGSGAPGTDDGGGGEVDASDEDVSLALPTAVTTFESIGLYWSDVPAPLDADDVDARVAYRVAGETAWRDGLPLWYDERDAQYRGSIVHLAPGTTYHVKLTLDSGAYRIATATTMAETFPIARTVELPELSTETLTITESGTADGYVLYTAAPGSTATIDVGKTADFDIVVAARYVIIRGVTLRGARHSGILLGDVPGANSFDVSDVVIEDSDISDWGTNATNDPACVAAHPGAGTYGVNLQAAIYSRSDQLTRVVIQRNKLHHPTTDANSWKEYNCAMDTFHPGGPQAISLFSSAGHLVIRYNEIYSDADHYFNDAMGETANFSDRGFPHRDADIHGNLVRHCWDDGLELEGGDMNVRVWGNYIDQTYIKIALASVARGPIYVWRNVAGASRTSPVDAYPQGFFKSRNIGGNGDNRGGGRVYIFHNTTWKSPAGALVASFIREQDEPDRIDNYRVLNNVIQVDDPTERFAISEAFAFDTVFDHDLILGRVSFSQPQEQHGLTGAPTFAAGAGFDDATGAGAFALEPGTAGFDHGAVIPNFSDGFTGAAPDLGAHEHGTGPIEVGVGAYRD